MRNLVTVSLAVVMTVFLLSGAVLAQSTDNVPLLTVVNDYPEVGYNDCWGYVGPAGREYALLGVEKWNQYYRYH